MKIGNCLLRRFCDVSVLSLVLFASIAAAVSAQPYPNKPIRIIVASAPAGGADFVSRIIGQKLTEAWGQQAIVDFRGGGGGNVGTEIAAKAPPDGYTLIVVATSHVISTSLYSKLSYDPVKDFAPITQITAQPYLLVVHSSVPAKTVKELIAFAKSKKGGITYASAGSGQASHLGMELFKTLGGFDAVHVPYKGAGPAMIDLIAGHVDTSLPSIPAALPHARAGKLRVLAVTSLKRSALLPDVPTVAETGLPGFEVSGLYGLLAPAGTPRGVVAKLYQEVSRSLKLPEVSNRMAEGGQDPVGSTPEEFAAYIQAEIIKWAKVIKQSGATAE